MKQHKDSQYDDDLTIGADEYDDSFQTSDVDLFEFGSDEDSAISRLKTLVLSIDWEITDEVLLQFNDEIQDLKDIWANEKIQMVYLQALEKIGKYIFRDKADSHPNAIRLLLSMYYNLERIVLSDELSGAEKKKLLLEDVRRFEKLKKLISDKEARMIKPPPASEPIRVVVPAAAGNELLDLKAIVLGIDWEITDNDLLALREEVIRLEEVYADSKPRLVFLQGIGTLGAYIRKKKSNAHADAFKILHSFYEGLEKLVRTPVITFEQEKEILRPEVKKYNAFKAVIADTLVRGEDVEAGEGEDEDTLDFSGSRTIAPAFADMPEDEVHGFQEEDEAKTLKTVSPINVDEHINRFFGEEEEQGSAATEVEPGEAAFSKESVEREAEEFSAAFFDVESIEEPDQYGVDRRTALQGVDVETEADDDSGEEALPVVKGEVAPALIETGGRAVFETVKFDEPVPESELAQEITGRLDDFFGVAEEPGEAAVLSSAFEIPADVALKGVDVETEADEEEEGVKAVIHDELAFVADENAPAFAEIEEELQETAEPPAEAEPAGTAWEATPEEVFIETPETLFAEGEVVAPDEELVAEEVARQLDEMFAALPGDDMIPVIEDREIEEDVEAFFTLEEAPEEFSAVELPVEEAEPAAEFLVPEAEEETVEAPEADPLADLRGCVQSISLELDDRIIQGLLTEISTLRHNWYDRPLEKAFLQLLSTVVQHIDQYRYGASDESSTLLSAVMGGLEKSRSIEEAKAQDLLLTNICAVLQWQQDMLNSQAVRGADGYLSFADQTQAEPDAMFEEREIEQEVFDALLTEPLFEPEEEAASFGMDLEAEGLKAGEEQPALSGHIDNAYVTDIVRREIDALRDTLKKEIAELRRAMNLGDSNT